MSDFLLATCEGAQGCLTSALRKIYAQLPPKIFEFKGDWGGLAVSQGHYKGFDPLETDTHICVVIGGPVLSFEDNNFLAGPNSNAGTLLILQRILAGTMSWETDLDGPFVVLLIDKVDSSVTCVTDMMMFIPVYEYFDNGKTVLGTHVDAVAVACGKRKEFDFVSLIDFILHDVVTFPHTAYQGVRQLTPAAIHAYSVADKLAASNTKPIVYWTPIEDVGFASIGEAAEELRAGLETYVGRITAGMDRVAQFISGGEDSRALSGLLPPTLKRDAYIFLDRMNREGGIAKGVAQSYGAEFNVGYRSPNYYLEILEPAGRLIGLGHQYTHAHALGFCDQFNLAKYSAVFGGYLSDSLLKGAYARKPFGYGYLPFLPEFSLKGELRSRALKNQFFRKDLLREVECRRRAHLDRIQKMRPHTAHEWFVLWPMTMRTTIPNFYSTRRLFASYEPFMSNASIKVSAAVPTKWKLNRRLFLATALPWLLPARGIQHADGRFPHLSWILNTPIKGATWASRLVQRKLLRKRSNEGPWGDWNAVTSSLLWAEKANVAFGSDVFSQLLESSNKKDLVNIFMGMKRQQQVNTLQIVDSVSKGDDQVLD